MTQYLTQTLGALNVTQSLTVGIGDTNRAQLKYNHVQGRPNASDIAQMTDWLKDCVWADMEGEDFDDLSDAQILKGVARHYGGGIAQFLSDSQ